MPERFEIYIVYKRRSFPFFFPSISDRCRLGLPAAVRLAHDTGEQTKKVYTVTGLNDPCAL